MTLIRMPRLPRMLGLAALLAVASLAVPAAQAQQARFQGKVTDASGQPVVGATIHLDPTDGTGDLEGHRLRPQEMRWLRDYNAGVARVCAARGARLIDVHGHFAGHGRSAPTAERWYWTGSLIEPGVVGASELRRLWLAALDAGGPGPWTRTRA